MKPVRPFRLHEVYAALCLDCGSEIESPVMPVPDYCYSCDSKRKRQVEAAQFDPTFPKAVKSIP